MTEAGEQEEGTVPGSQPPLDNDNTDPVVSNSSDNQNPEPVVTSSSEFDLDRDCPLTAEALAELFTAARSPVNDLEQPTNNTP